MSSDDPIRASLPASMHQEYDHLMAMPDSAVRAELIDKLQNLADPRRGALPAEARGEHDRIMQMASSPIRDQLLS